MHFEEQKILYKLVFRVLGDLSSKSRIKEKFTFEPPDSEMEIEHISLIRVGLRDFLISKDTGDQILHFFLLDLLESFRRSPRKWTFSLVEREDSSKFQVETEDYKDEKQETVKKAYPTTLTVIKL